MVADAREKLIDRKKDKYGADFVDEAIGGVASDKWRSGLQSSTRDDA
jgi:hypothetical protein